MRFRPLLLAITSSAALALPSLSPRAAEPAAHATQSTHAAAKAGATPQPGASAINGAPVNGAAFGQRGAGASGRRLHDMRPGDTAVHGLPTPSGGGVRPGPTKPAGTLGVGTVQGAGAPVRNSAQINGTGMARKGVGPASIGPTAKSRTGINGTGMGK